MTDKDITLEDLVATNGRSVDDMTIIPTDEGIKEIEQKFSKFAYDDTDYVIPGSPVVMPTSDDIELSKEDADKKLLSALADEKLRKEQEAFNKLSDNEKIKHYVLETELRRAVNDFYNKHHYEMTGSQKRITKRQIERAWKKGKIRLTEDQKQDILYELNKASHTKNTAQPTQMSNPSGQVAANLQSLMSL